jgi:hypothetical protein
MKRPHGIVTLASVLALGGVVFLLGAGALLLADQLQIYRSAIAAAGVGHDTQIGTGLFALASGISLLALAVGLFYMQRWAWGLGVLIMGANVAFAAIEIHNGALLAPDQIVTLITATAVLLYLLAPGVVRAFFRKGADIPAQGAS